MPSVSEIVGLHEQLLDGLRSEELLGQWVIIRDVEAPNWRHKKFEAPNWRHKKFQGDVGFELYPTGTPEYGLTDFKKKVAVFPLHAPRRGGGALEEAVPITTGATVWASWFEHWKKLPTEAFALVTAKWLVFWGEAGDDDKIQIVRAEWDQTSFLEEIESEAGQPHWHIDRDLELGEATSVSARGSELEEIGGTRLPSRRVTIQDVHLAMAGWNNEPEAPGDAVPKPETQSKKGRKEEARSVRERERKKRKGLPVNADDQVKHAIALPRPATVWQRQCRDDPGDLVQWAIHTLRYIKSQARHIREL